MDGFEYNDIINMEYLLKNRDYVKHPKMDVQDRAKIFAPFAALRGHSDELKSKHYDEYEELERCIIEECMTEENDGY